MEHPQYDDVIAHGPIHDHEWEAVQWQLANKAVDTRGTIRMQCDEPDATIGFLNKVSCCQLTSFRIPARRICDVSVRFITDQNGAVVHPRIAFSARLRTCSGVKVLASPRR